MVVAVDTALSPVVLATSDVVELDAAAEVEMGPQAEMCCWPRLSSGRQMLMLLVEPVIYAVKILLFFD